MTDQPVAKPEHQRKASPWPRIRQWLFGDDHGRERWLLAWLLFFVGSNIQSLANEGASTDFGSAGALIAILGALPLLHTRFLLLIIIPLFWIGSAMLSLFMPLGPFASNMGWI